MTFWDWLRDHGASIGAILTPTLFGVFLIWQIDGVKTDLSRRMDGVDRRIDSVDTRMDELKTDLAMRVDGVDKRMDSVRSDLAGRMDELKSELSRRIDGVDKRIDSVDTRMDELKTDLAMRVDGVDKRMDSVRSDLAGRMDELKTELTTGLERLWTEVRSNRAEAMQNHIGVSRRLDGLYVSFNDISAQLTASDAVTAGGDGLALRLLAGHLVRTPVVAFLEGVSGVERQNARGRWVQAAIADGVLTLHPEDEGGRALLTAYGWRPEDPDNPGSGLVVRKELVSPERKPAASGQ